MLQQTYWIICCRKEVFKMNIGDIWYDMSEEEKQKTVDLLNMLMDQARAIHTVQDVIKSHIAILKESGITESSVREILNVFVQEVYK